SPRSSRKSRTRPKRPTDRRRGGNEKAGCLPRFFIGRSRYGDMPWASVPGRRLRRIVAVRRPVEKLAQLRMPDRLAGLVLEQVLFGYISDVFCLRILGQKMVERLILARPHLFRDRLVPFL